MPKQNVTSMEVSTVVVKGNVEYHYDTHGKLVTTRELSEEELKKIYGVYYQPPKKDE